MTSTQEPAMTAAALEEIVSPCEAVRRINKLLGVNLPLSYLYRHLDEIPTVEVSVRRVRIADLPVIAEKIKRGFARSPA